MVFKKISKDKLKEIIKRIRILSAKLNFENIKKFCNSLREDKKKMFYTLLILFFIFLILVGFYSYKLYTTVEELNQKTHRLKEISSYDLKSKIKNQNGEEIKRVSGIIDFGNYLEKEKDRIEKVFEDLQSPYDVLLKHFYLPSLNIWEDPYSGKIDIGLIGKNFLQENNYIDTNLLNHWSKFFRDMGRNLEYNEITNIKIGEIKNQEGGFFYIPIDVSFNASSRNAFVLLVNKLSLTSNKGNILLINEFFYQLWQEIKFSESGPNKISLLKNKISFLEDKSDDFIIGYIFYNWIKNDTKNLFLQGEEGEKIIDRTIRNVANCGNNKDTASCYFDFRDDYSNIPYLSYKIAHTDVKDKTKNLKDFLKDFPPLLNIDKFSFREVKKNDNSEGFDKGYVGEISIKVYGRTITDKGRLEIASVLGDKCFDSDGYKVLPKEVLSLINETIKYRERENVDASNIRKYLELKDIVSKMIDEFENLNNYNKTLKQFELYRMLKVNSLCNK